MKVYQLRYDTPDQGRLLVWCGSRRRANRAIKQIQGRLDFDDSEMTDFIIAPHDIPTDKPGLLAWLNTHFKTDNG